jgi:hypothetical protein
LNSTLSQQEKKIVLGDLMQRQPTTRLLYITPELAATQSFLSIIKKVHQRKLVNYLIIDEGEKLHFSQMRFIFCFFQLIVLVNGVMIIDQII